MRASRCKEPVIEIPVFKENWKDGGGEGSGMKT